MRSNDKSIQRSEDSVDRFKARKMPKYNFFEVKHDSHKKVLFKEFKLATNERLESKKRSTSQDEEILSLS